MIGLGIDAGASSTRWLLLEENGVMIAQGRVGAITGHIFTERDLQENLHRLEMLLDTVLQTAKPDAVAAGITGLERNSDAAQLYAEQIGKALQIELVRVDVDNDMHIAYASTFAPGQGVLVYAGTGSIAYHKRVDGTVMRAGGNGYLIDDAGGGFWIGREGLKLVLRWADEVGQVSERPLANAIYRSLQCCDWNDIRRVVYDSGRSSIAALAPAVADAAAAGDDAAIDIIERAGGELGRLVNVLLNRIKKPLPVAFCGGIVKLHPLLIEALQGSLPATSPLHLVTEEPVRTAARLAMRLDDNSG